MEAQPKPITKLICRVMSVEARFDRIKTEWESERSSGRGLLMAILISTVVNGGLLVWIARSAGWL